jgi:uncharacterized Zn-finger protein
MSGHQTRHAYVRAASESTQRNSFSMFLLPACGRMGEAALDHPRRFLGIGWSGRLPFAGAKDRSLSCRLGDFQFACHTNNKNSHPLCTGNGSHLRGAQLPADDTGQKKSAPTHTATEKPLTGSTVTSPNFHIKRAAVQRA